MNWGAEETEYLESNWGARSIPTIAKNLNKPIGAIINKKERMKLGSFLESGDYITVNQLFKAIGREGGTSYTLAQWINKGFPLKKKRVVNYSFKIVYLNDFWKWAEEYRMHIDFAKLKENALGEEPTWVKKQRAADIAFSKYKTTPWTPKEDTLFKSLLKSYKYTYKELSLRLLRTEGAIKRRYHDLKIKEWPIRQEPHGIWTDEQINTVIQMYQKGYRCAVIKDYIDKSEQGECIYEDGIIRKDAAIHCSEGRKKLKIE